MLVAFAILIAPVAHAHPDVATHLHVPPPSCAMGGDDVSRIRRAGVLTDAARFGEALAELDAVCHPGDEMVRLARARTALRAGRPADALAAVNGLSGPDAALWRGQSLAALGRAEEASLVLADALQSLPDAPPQDYLDAASALPAEHALAVLQLGLARRGDISALRRAASVREAELGRLDAAVARLSHPNDGLLRGDLLRAAGREADAQQAWADAIDFLAQGRSTPANTEARKTLLQRMDTP